MNPVRLYFLHFANINKLYDTYTEYLDKKKELASRVPGCATLQNRVLLNILWWIVVVVEPFLSIFIATFYFPYFIYKVLTRKSVSKIGNHIGLCYAGLSVLRIKAVEEVNDMIDYYLYPIFVEDAWVMKDKPKHNVLEHVKLVDVVKAYFWSLLAIVFATLKTHGKYLYRNYLCYEYLLTYYFLKRLSNEKTLYFVNHLDRWAVLFNLAPQKNKVLLQHGIEAPWADWPVKLTNVTKAFIFSDSQRERMINAVLGHEPEIVIMPPTITLSNMPGAMSKNIVIIACENYRFFEEEKYVIRHLKNDKLKIFVKIHPGKNDFQKYVDLRNNENPNVEIINTPTFPNVNAVVSYYSTLGVEYEAHNIPVYYYKEMSLEDIVDKIKNL